MNKMIFALRPNVVRVAALFGAVSIALVQLSAGDVVSAAGTVFAALSAAGLKKSVDARAE